MKNVMVEYTYTGDEQAWQQLIADFLNAVEADTRLKGHFHYQVFSMPEGRKVHIGRWDSEETLKALQSQVFFTTFAQGVKGFAGESLKSGFGNEVFSTGT
jgi:quinol monooxygenase YgiN